MFEQMVVRKDATLIERYYDPDFELYTNGEVQTYDEYAAGHRRVYATDITYRVEYDDDAWVVGDDRVAGRVWITTQLPDEKPTKIEVVLIAAYRDGRLYRLWELTWPDWSRLQAFDEY
ncbi:MAG: nuclear transport factor 2 family protein [Gordonia sp. (in: high G+C Gram-positive bacteria)]|uniref:nuclear transport factor 2 family protein n=1 Tax=Gordonia sp. (in: high G+C Gram-positive bacteria) TaxID=84139 RepID=UPI0039E217B3